MLKVDAIFIYTHATPCYYIQYVFCFLAILICLPANDVGYRTLEALDQLRLAEDFDSLSILVDISTLPMWLPHFLNTTEETKILDNITTSYHMKKYLLLFTDTELTGQRFRYR